MAFASMGVSEVKLGRGIPALRVHCSTYHLMGPLALVGSANDQPKFATLYFFDNNEATRARTRLDIFQGFASTPGDASRALNILTTLEQVIAEHNPFHGQFLTAIAAAE